MNACGLTKTSCSDTAMAMNLERVWELPADAGHYEKPAPVTDSQLRAFEQRHGAKLPPTLEALYRKQNGGFSLLFGFSFWPVEQGTNADMTSLQILVETFHEDSAQRDRWRNALGPLENAIVFLGDGHFYIVLNYNDAIEGDPVVWQVDDTTGNSTRMTFDSWITKHTAGA